MSYEALAIRVFNRTKFMQIMKHSVINYWGASWPEIDRTIAKLNDRKR